MCQFHHRHSIFCIVPPHMLRRIAERGTPEQRAVANRSLAIDETLRAMRVARGAGPSPAGPPSVGDTGAQRQRSIFNANSSQVLPGTRRPQRRPGSDGRCRDRRSLRWARRHLRFLLRQVRPQLDR